MCLYVIVPLFVCFLCVSVCVSIYSTPCINVCRICVEAVYGAHWHICVLSGCVQLCVCACVWCTHAPACLRMRVYVCVCVYACVCVYVCVCVCVCVSDKLGSLTCSVAMAPPVSRANRQLRAEVRMAAAVRPPCHTRLGSTHSHTNTSTCSWKRLREREREREKEKKRERERERERGKEREKKREREREREKERGREREREKNRDREREREGGRERKGGRERERE